jgi:hypothetical protein
MQCGEKINDTAKFCHVCGASQVIPEANEAQQVSSNLVSATEKIVENKTKNFGFLWLIIIAIFVLVAIANADKFKLINPEQNALEDFKQSTEAQYINNCVGANGEVNWSIFSSEKAEKNVRVVEAQLSKKDKKFTIQYLYNLDTKVKEVSYMSNDDKPKSKFEGALEFSSFCL